MKFTISDTPQPIDSLLRTCIGDFLATLQVCCSPSLPAFSRLYYYAIYLLQDPDLNVRRVALVAFNSAAHNKPSLIRDLLKNILPQLYNETKVS